jgi:hypothetical protein
MASGTSHGVGMNQKQKISTNILCEDHKLGPRIITGGVKAADPP